MTRQARWNALSPPHPGRKPFAPTEHQRKQILTMTGFGMRQEEMCAMLEDKQIDALKLFPA